MRRVFLCSIIIALCSGCGFLGHDFGPQGGGADADDGFSTTVSSLRESRYIDQCTATTEEDDDDGTLEAGETTEGDLDLVLKNTCGEDVVLKYQLCLVEKGEDARQRVSRDWYGQPMCGDYETVLECKNYRLVEGDTTCVNGYCEVRIGPGSAPMECGWQVTAFAAYTPDGELLEDFDQDALQEIGFELLQLQVLPEEAQDTP